MATTTKSSRKSAPPQEHTEANCHARELLTRVGDKWSVCVLHSLSDEGTMRFSELQRRIDGVSQRMLTVTLRGLERDGLLERTVYAEIPPRVEYKLTKLGATLRAIVRSLIDWSGAHVEEVASARKKYDKTSSA